MVRVNAIGHNCMVLCVWLCLWAGDRPRETGKLLRVIRSFSNNLVHSVMHFCAPSINVCQTLLPWNTFAVLNKHGIVNSYDFCVSRIKKFDYSNSSIFFFYFQLFHCFYFYCIIFHKRHRLQGLPASYCSVYYFSKPWRTAEGNQLWWPTDMQPAPAPALTQRTHSHFHATPSKHSFII